MNTATATYRKRKLNGRMNKSVQDPTCAQSFNKYAYCMNNPLRYVDPSGEKCCGLSGAELEHIAIHEAQQRCWREIQRMLEKQERTRQTFVWFAQPSSGSLYGNGDGSCDGNGYNTSNTSEPTTGDGNPTRNGDEKQHYKWPINDNFGKRNGECVYRCLEEFGKSYGIDECDFDYWCDLASQVFNRETIDENGNVTGVHPNSINELVNSSDFFSCEEVFREDVGSWVDAYESGDRLMIAISGHAAMIQSLTTFGDCGYKVGFAETSQVRLVGYYSYNVSTDYPGCRIFRISLKP